jgi:hypothetical protein
MTVASPMRNGQEPELDRLLAMMLMDEDRIYAQTATRRVPFTNHRPPPEKLINGHARRRFPTGIVFTHEPRDFDDAQFAAVAGLPTEPLGRTVGLQNLGRPAVRGFGPFQRPAPPGPMPPACRWEAHVRRQGFRAEPLCR